MQFLRQSTAITLRFGPFITLSTNLAAPSLTIQKANVLLSKADAALAAAHADQGASDAGAAYDAAGMYAITLDATDTATLGRLKIHIAGTALVSWPAPLEYVVLPAAVYDALVAGTANLQIDIVKLLGTAIATPTVAGIPKVEIASADTDVLNATALATSAVNELVAALNNLSLSQVQTACKAALDAVMNEVPKRYHD